MPLTSSTSNDSNRISDIPLKSLHNHTSHHEDISLDNIKFIDENENIECGSQTDRCGEEDAPTNEK